MKPQIACARLVEVFILSFLALGATPANAQVVSPSRGGTGTGSVPAVGQVLVGQANGTYAPQATSSLGITAGGGSGITTLNGLTGSSQTFATTSANAGWGFSSSGTTHTLNIPTASASNALGLLSSADWSNFYGKENILSFVYPLVRSVNSISLAFGTTTSNTWAGTQTFTNAPVLGSLTGFIKANAGALAAALINLTSDVTGILPVANGGTNISTYTTGDLLYASNATTLSRLGRGAAGTVLWIAANNLPAWTATSSLGISGGAGTNYFTNSGASTYLSTGTNLGIGTATPSTLLHVYGTSTSSPYAIIGGTQPLLQVGGYTPPYGYLANDRINSTDNRNDYSVINSYNFSSGNCATADLSAANDLAANAAFFADLGHTSSGFTGSGCINNPFTGFGANSSYLFDPSGNINFAIGSSSPNTSIRFLTQGYDTTNERMRLTSAGNLGIGTTTPFKALTVSGEGYFTGTSTASCFTTNGSTCLGGTGTVTNVATNSTLTGGPITTTGTLGLNLASQNTWTGNLTVSTTSTDALDVGQNGATNPAFQVDTSTASSATGLKLTSAAAAGGVTLQTLSSGTNEALSVLAKGTGALTFGANVGNTINIGGTVSSSINLGRLSLTGSTFSLPLATAANTVTPRFLVTNSADAALSQGNEATYTYFNAGLNTRTHNSNVAIATQRDFRITGSTHAFTTANGTITNNAVFSVDGPTIAGTSTLITNGIGIYVPGTAVNASTTNSYGASIAASTGAQNNYAATFTGGRVGIGTTTPASDLQIATSTASATTTLEVGRAGQGKGSCLVMYDAAGTVQYVSILSGAFLISATSCK